ncbi:MAG TPA: hypothetical protein VKW06_13925 [Candidatus Angelobacter sp.]|nr:hypothetical protein [Candidatus Angelobacter sp.]
MATSSVLAEESLSWFVALAESYAYDPASILHESNVAKSLRSLKSLMSRAGGSVSRRRIDEFWLQFKERRRQFLPSAEQVRREFLPLLEPIRSKYPYVTTNLSLSSPAATKDAVSINVLTRLYDRAGRQQIKIKFGSFLDQTGALFWEVGFVDLRKSIHGKLHDLLNQVGNDPGDYFLLSRLVSWTKGCICSCKQVSGLDLTPAYYHVTSLCRRLGGVPQDRARQEIHVQQIDRAFERRAEENREWRTLGLGPCRRWVISWLLYRELLLDSDGAAITWNPSRFIWKT